MTIYFSFSIDTFCSNRERLCGVYPGKNETFQQCSKNVSFVIAAGEFDHFQANGTVIYWTYRSPYYSPALISIAPYNFSPSESPLCKHYMFALVIRGEQYLLSIDFHSTNSKIYPGNGSLSPSTLRLPRVTFTLSTRKRQAGRRKHQTHRRRLSRFSASK